MGEHGPGRPPESRRDKEPKPAEQPDRAARRKEMRAAEKSKKKDSKKSGWSSTAKAAMVAGGVGLAGLGAYLGSRESPAPHQTESNQTQETKELPGLKIEIKKSEDTPAKAIQPIVSRCQEITTELVREASVQKILKRYPDEHALKLKINIEPRQLDITPLPEAERKKAEQETNAALDDAEVFFAPSRLTKANVQVHALVEGEKLSEVKQPQFDEKNNAIDVQIVRDVTARLNFSVELQLPDGSTRAGKGDVSQDHPFAGQSNRSLNVARNQEIATNVAWTREAVIAEQKSDQVQETAWSVTPGEILHNQLARFTDARRTKAIIGKRLRTTEDLSAQADYFGNEEEAVVHAADLLWVQTYAAKKGMPMTEKQFDVWRDMYPGTARLLQAVKGMNAQDGANQIIKWYLEEPEKIRQITGLK